MKTIYEDYKHIKNDTALTVAIGNFDGLHLGHQNLLETAKSFKDTKSAVLTFTPHPISVISGIDIPTLSRDDDKEKLVECEGIDYYLHVKFTKEFARLSVAEFIEFLKSIQVKRIVVGRDFRFAYQGSGNVDILEKYFEVVVVGDMLYKHARISTSFIKQLLDVGNLDEVSVLLKRPYKVSGIVVHGDKIGRTLGFPTANIDYGNYYLPKNGIYYVKVYVDDKIHDGVLNLGHNPTVNFSAKKRLEVFILDFDEDIYDKRISVEFLRYLREEMKFSNVDDLLKQMKQDVVDARKNKNML